MQRLQAMHTALSLEHRETSLLQVYAEIAVSTLLCYCISLAPGPTLKLQFSQAGNVLTSPLFSFFLLLWPNIDALFLFTW